MFGTIFVRILGTILVTIFETIFGAIMGAVMGQFCGQNSAMCLVCRESKCQLEEGSVEGRPH